MTTDATAPTGMSLRFTSPYKCGWRWLHRDHPANAYHAEECVAVCDSYRNGQLCQLALPVLKDERQKLAYFCSFSVAPEDCTERRSVASGCFDKYHSDDQHGDEQLQLWCDVARVHPGELQMTRQRGLRELALVRGQHHNGMPQLDAPLPLGLCKPALPRLWFFLPRPPGAVSRGHVHQLRGQWLQ